MIIEGNILDIFSRMLNKSRLITKDEALEGRAKPIESGDIHAVLGVSYHPPFDSTLSTIVVGMGCFWGVERLFWQIDGVYTTAVGYCAGYTPNPTYDEVCSGLTAHNEVVLVVFDEKKVSLNTLLQAFWENHDPTQGLRQGNDRGSQYRSGLYCLNDQQKAAAEASLSVAQEALRQKGLGDITTEIKTLKDFYYAETYHQQYLDKNPDGYCALRGVGITVDLD